MRLRGFRVLSLGAGGVALVAPVFSRVPVVGVVDARLALVVRAGAQAAGVAGSAVRGVHGDVGVEAVAAGVCGQVGASPGALGGVPDRAALSAL